MAYDPTNEIELKRVSLYFNNQQWYQDEKSGILIPLQKDNPQGIKFRPHWSTKNQIPIPETIEAGTILNFGAWWYREENGQGNLSFQITKILNPSLVTQPHHPPRAEIQAEKNPSTIQDQIDDEIPF